MIAILITPCLDTWVGGAGGYDTVFKMIPNGTLTTLYSFCTQSGCQGGAYPEAGLVQGTDGDFYGATGAGGAFRVGTVFTVTRSGTLTTLHSFDDSDGVGPSAGLIQGRDGSFYGTPPKAGRITAARSSASAWFAGAQPAVRDLNTSQVAKRNVGRDGLLA